MGTQTNEDQAKKKTNYLISQVQLILFVFTSPFLFLFFIRPCTLRDSEMGVLN